MLNIHNFLLRNKEERLRGIALSGGIAYGKICFAKVTTASENSERKINKEQIDSEFERYDNACHAVVATMKELHKRISTKIGKPEAAIIEAQMMIVEDENLHNDILKEITESLVTAERAVTTVLNRYAKKFHELEDVYFKDRANDIEDIKQRILEALGYLHSTFACDSNENCVNGEDRVIATKELTPSMTFKISPDSTYGFITQHGGVNSHAAILARALNIPAVSGIPNLMGSILCGQEVIINGDTGELIISPSNETKKLLLAQKLCKTSEATVEPLSGFKVMATISHATDAETAKEAGAEGIGLYRTEYEFMKENSALTEEEQLSRYRVPLEIFREQPVYFRMLDIGGDKNANWIDVPNEPNPYLGLRGARLLLKRPDLFIPQARALAKASEITGQTVYVMYPMVINEAQFLKLKEQFIDATKDIKCSVKHGLMFETPSACLQCDEIMQVADFATIGTNDLTQYLLAVDRNNELVADEYDSSDPTMWKLIRRVAFAADFNNKPISICGDLASDSNYLKHITEANIRSISVYPRKVNSLRNGLKDIVYNSQHFNI